MFKIQKLLYPIVLVVRKVIGLKSTLVINVKVYFLTNIEQKRQIDKKRT